MRFSLRFFSSTTAIALAAVSSLWAEIPSGYYSRLDGKSGAELKTAAFEIINPHTKVSSYSNLPQYFAQTDVYPDSRQWWDMYSDNVRYAPSFSGLNREHSVPKSWWKLNGSVEYTPAYVDLNHLYPSDISANSAKNNYPLGIVGDKATFDNGVCKVGYPVSGYGGGAQYVFEPSDNYKGDFARTYFYMATCYQDLTWKYNYMFQNNDYPTLSPWALTMLLDWHRNDPVSDKELDRNEVVYKYQNNRNPFIDFPELAEYIWGDKVGQKFSPGTSVDTPTGDPLLINPVNLTSLDFAQTAVGNKSTAILYIKGENIVGNVSLRISGTDKNMFTLDPSSSTPKLSTTIAGSRINTANGYQLQVTYNPTTTGNHSARITIYDANLSGSTTVNLIGEALDVPTLSRLTAYDAADITATSYKASWSEAPETVDYYLLTRQRFVNGVMTEETIECDENFVVIDDFNASDNENYYVQSSRLGFLSEPSNVVSISHSGINGISEDAPLSVEVYPSTIRFRCGNAQTGGRIYDSTGRTVSHLPEITDGLEITLPIGVYFIVTDNHHTPIKLIAR